MTNLYGNVAWSVVQPAQEDPLADSCVPSEEAEAAYISNEFLNVWDKQGQSVISVPKTFPDPKTDGEKAEKALFEVLKEAGSNDPNLRLIIFNGLRSSGAADENSDLKLIREIDSAVFLESNKTKKSASYMEVKCCKNESGLKSHRKKATNQLNKHVSMLNNLGMSKEETDKISLYTVWPNLSGKEPCKNSNCPEGGWHPRFKPKEKVCWDPGMTDPPQFDPRVKHIFKEDLEVTNVKSLLQNMAEENEIEEETWLKMLMRETRHACGALYDEISERFYLLGPDQQDLRESAEHKIMEPRIIEGKAGTGKTLTIAAKIERLLKEGKITSSRKAVYICYSDQGIEQMRFMLRNISLENIEVVNARVNPNFSNLIENPQKIINSVQTDGIHYFFMDETEDLSEKNALASIYQWSTDDCNVDGHCWFMFDQYQSHNPSHQHFLLASRVTGDVRWTGHTIDRSLFGDRIETLQTIFRMTHQSAVYIKNNHLIPDMEVNMAHDIEGLKASSRNVEIDSWNKLKQTLLDEIIKSALKLNCDRNIHPGKIAFLVPDSDYKDIIGDKTKQVLDELNNEMRSKFVEPKKKDIIPQFTNKICDNFLKMHDQDIKHCTCKFYFGCVSDVKGLDIQVAHLLQITVADDFYKIGVNNEHAAPCSGCTKTWCQFKIRRSNKETPRSRSSDTGEVCVLRTWPLYTAVTRSTCEFQVTNLLVEEAVLVANSIYTVLEVRQTKSEENSFKVNNQIYDRILGSGSMSMFGCNTDKIFWNTEEDMIVTRSTNMNIVQIFGLDNIPTVLEQVNVTCLDMTNIGNIVTVSSNPDKLTTWTSGGEMINSVQTQHSHHFVKYSQEGSYIVCTGNYGRKISVYRTADLHLVYTEEGIYRSLACCGDDSITYQDKDYVLRHVVITAEGPQVQQIKTEGNSVEYIRNMQWDNQGRYLAVSFSNDVRIWTLQTQTWKTLTTGYLYSRYLIWVPHPGQAVLATYYSINDVRLWNVETMQCLQTLNTKNGIKADGLQFSSSGTLLAVASDNEVSVWDRHSGQQVTQHQVKNKGAIRWGPGDDKIAIINLLEGSRVEVLPVAHQAAEGGSGPAKKTRWE